MDEIRDIDVLLKRLRDGSSDDPDAEWKAAVELGRVKDAADRQKVIPALEAAVVGDWAHALIRAHAVESLGKLGDSQAVPALSAAVQRDEYRLVRAYAIGPLAKLGEPLDVMDILLEVVETDDFYGVRAEAVAEVSELAANSEESAVRQRVAQALIRTRKREISQQEPGYQRVVAEVDRGLERIGR